MISERHPTMRFKMRSVAARRPADPGSYVYQCPKIGNLNVAIN